MNNNNTRKSNELMKTKLTKLIESEATIRRIADEANNELICLRKEIETEKRMRRLIESNTKSGEAEKMRLINAETTLRATITNLEKEVERNRVDLERERRMRSIAEANSKKVTLDHPKVKNVEATYIKALEKKGNELERAKREVEEEKSLRAKVEREVRAMKKDKEIDVAKINSMSEQINAVVRDKKTSMERNGELDLEVEKIKEELVALKEQHDASLKQIEALKQVKIENDEANDHAMNVLQMESREKEEAHKEELVKAQVEINVLQAANQCMDRDLKELSNRLLDTEKRLEEANLETSSLQGRTCGLEMKVGRLEKQIEEEQKKFEDLKREFESKVAEAETRYDELDAKRSNVDGVLTTLCAETLRSHEQILTNLGEIIDKLSPTTTVKGKVKKRKIKKQDTDDAFVGLKGVAEALSQFKLSSLDNVLTSDGESVWKSESNEEEVEVSYTSTEPLESKEVDSSDLEPRAPMLSQDDDDFDLDD